MVRFFLPILTLSIVLTAACVDLAAQTPCAVSRIEDCPETGCGWDKLLNVKKNLLPEPGPTPETLTLEELKRFDYPQRWAVGQSREELKRLGEGRLVKVRALLVDAEWGDLSPANCNLVGRENTNVILFLVSEDAIGLETGLRKQTAVTAEITPRVRARHLQWTRKALERLIISRRHDALPVRVTGLMLLDTGRVYNPRGRFTDWEIHPVVEIEVCAQADGCPGEAGWRKLDETPIPKPPRRTHPRGKTRRKRRGPVIRPR